MMNYLRIIDDRTGYISYDIYEDGVCLGRCSPEIAKLIQTLDNEGHISDSVKQETVKQIRETAWESPAFEDTPCPHCGGTVGHRVNCPDGIAFSDA